MRVSFGNVQGNSFIFRNTSEALVDLNPMPPGTYDVVLYDTAQERRQAAERLHVEADAASRLAGDRHRHDWQPDAGAGARDRNRHDNSGRRRDRRRVAAPLPETTRVYAGPVLEIPIEKAVRVPVSIRIGCAVRAPQGVPQCAVGDSPLQPLTMLVLNTSLGALPFQIDQIRGAQPLEAVDVVVQITGRRELLAQVKPGDTDYGQYVNPLAAGAVVASVGTPMTLGGDTERVDIKMRAQAQRNSSGWTYASAPLRVGGGYSLRTPKYELQGIVVQIAPEWTEPSAVQATPGQ